MDTEPNTNPDTPFVDFDGETTEIAVPTKSIVWTLAFLAMLPVALFGGVKLIKNLAGAVSDRWASWKAKKADPKNPPVLETVKK